MILHFRSLAARSRAGTIEGLIEIIGGISAIRSARSSLVAMRKSSAGCLLVIISPYLILCPFKSFVQKTSNN